MKLYSINTLVTLPVYPIVTKTLGFQVETAIYFHIVNYGYLTAGFAGQHLQFGNQHYHFSDRTY